MDKKTILEHVLVPKHEILGEEETKELLKKLGVTTEQLPKIKEKDAAAEEIEAKKGQVIKITRISPTAGESIYYRVVI